MSRLPSINLPAPIGMDVTSDPVQTPVSKAQLVVNYQTNYAGRLRGKARTIDVLPVPMANPIDGLAYYYQATITNPQVGPFQTDLYLIFSGGILYYSIPSSDPFNIPGSNPVAVAASNLGNSYFQGGVFIGKRIRSASLNDEIIFVQDGGVQPQRFFSGTLYGTHYFQAGIVPPPAPTATATGTGITGVYEYLVTYYDERGRESSPSPLSAPVTLTNQAGHVTIAWGANLPRTGFDRQIKGAYVYRNLSGGSVWYRVGNVVFGNKNPLLAYTLTVGDWIFDLSAANDASTDATVSTGVIAPNPGENDVPNPASVVAVHKNRTFLNDVTDNSTLQVSNNGTPTQFASIPAAPLIATDGVRMKIGTDQGDPMTALVEFGDVLAIFKRRGCYFLWGNDLQDFTIRPIHERGCIAPDSAQRCDNFVFYLSDDGVYAASYQQGEQVEKVSGDIEKWLLSYPQSALANSFAYYVDHRYHLCVGNATFVYDFTSKGWHVEIFGFGVFDLGIPGYPPVLFIPPNIIADPNGNPLPNTTTGPPRVGNPNMPNPNNPNSPIAPAPNINNPSGPPSPSQP